MAVTRLTTAQRSAVRALKDLQRIETVPTDELRAQNFVRQAEDALADLHNVTRHQNAYNLAYDAAHDIGEAMLAAYGYRTKTGPGQHEALGRFLMAIFDSPPENAAARHYEQMRRERNQQRYAARPVTEAATRASGQAATTLFTAARNRLGLAP